MPKTYTIDAHGKMIGRIASEAATYLMGKNTPEFAKNKIPKVSVTIVNASKANILDKKKKETIYTHYTGYPGGLRKLSMEQVIAKKGYQEIFRKAIYGMLPTNKLRSKMIKNLTVTE